MRKLEIYDRLDFYQNLSSDDLKINEVNSDKSADPRRLNHKGKLN